MKPEEVKPITRTAWASHGILSLLLFSFVLTLGRAATLPFMAVHLSQVLQMSIPEIGIVLSVSLAMGTVAGLWAGYLTDKLGHARSMAAAAIGSAIVFLALPSLSGIWIIMIALGLLYAILAMASIAVKASISASLAEDQRIGVFSLNYTLVNVGFALGPLISVYLLASDTRIAFWFAVAMCLLAAAIVMLSPPADHRDDKPKTHLGIRSSFAVVRGDRLLLLFTVGGFLSAVVYDQFSAYLSQYLLTFLAADQAHTLIGQIVTANALVVITTQYWLGRQIKRQTLLSIIVIGTACLIFGLIGFSWATVPFVWILAMAIFTIGEIMLVPAEYFYVDLIASKPKLGLYFAVHNLSALGGAISPVLCSVLLVLGGPTAMFGVLIVCALGGAALYVVGDRRMRSTQENTNT